MIATTSALQFGEGTLVTRDCTKSMASDAVLSDLKADDYILAAKRIER